MSAVPVADRLDIQELSAQYAFRCNTRAYNDIGELFTSDGVWDETVIGLPRGEGATGIGAFFSAMAQSDLEYIVHVNANHQFTDFTGDTASATVHLHAKGRFNHRDIEILGYHVDDYAKIDGTWLFRSRVLNEFTPSTGILEP